VAAVWLSLAVLVACLLGGAWYAFTRTREVVRALRELGGGVSDALARLDEAAARVSDSAARAPGSADSLQPSLERLARSRAQLSVLAAALGEASDLGRGVRGLVPRK
jgi:hypothetical protein